MYCTRAKSDPEVATVTDEFAFQNYIPFKQTRHSTAPLQAVMYEMLATPPHSFCSEIPFNMPILLQEEIN